MQEAANKSAGIKEMLGEEQLRNNRLEDEARSLKISPQAEKERGTALETQLQTRHEEVAALKASIAEKAAQVCTPDLTHFFFLPRGFRLTEACRDEH
jgi:hypothetical protein